MPITGPSSYIPTVNQFLQHWTDVNAALGAGHELILADGSNRATLAGLLSNLETARDAVSDAGVDDSLARGVLSVKVTALQARLVQFNAAVRAGLPGSAFAAALGDAFSVGDAEGTVRDALRRASAIWARINLISPAPPGLTLPLLLLGGYAQGQFNLDREALRTAYQALTDAEVELALARGRRNDVQAQIYPILKNYRLKVPTVFPLGSALVMTLPALTPSSGHTPAAVAAQGTWDGPAQKAKITWAASPDPALAHYEVRGCPGDAYNGDDESILATVLPTGARSFETDFALGTVGAVAGFKVYVVLTTGNERGSEAVYVSHLV